MQDAVEFAAIPGLRIETWGTLTLDVSDQPSILDLVRLSLNCLRAREPRKRLR
jgi:hypothetical protein